jgi:hypothetical protein
MKTNSKIFKFFVLLSFLCCQNISVAQQLNQKFDTKNHTKAKGVWAQVRYPVGWTAKEGQRPNIVQLFVGKYEGIEIQLQLQIKDAGEDVEKDCANISPAEWNESFTDKESNMYATNSRKIKIEGKNGFTSELSAVIQRVDLKMSMAAKQMTVCHKKNYIFLWCGNFIDGENVQQAKKNINKVEALCQQYFNSFVLMERY